MIEMLHIRNRARLLAAIALAWQIVAVAAVSAALSFDPGSGHAGMANCPLHQNVPACPVHADKHGTHECDCPTIGCSQTDAEFLSLFGSIGILPSRSYMHVPPDAGSAAWRVTQSAHPLAHVPLSPPPRS